MLNLFSWLVAEFTWRWTFEIFFEKSDTISLNNIKLKDFQEKWKNDHSFYVTENKYVSSIMPWNSKNIGKSFLQEHKDIYENFASTV